MTSPTLEVRSVYKSYDEGRIEALRGVRPIDRGRRVCCHYRTERKRQVNLAPYAWGTGQPDERRGSFRE